jgi:exodeoxyribonuclease-3
MRLTITTWNINSVRLRIDGVARFVKAVRPDVLCLQETKCPDDRFPVKRFKRLGYEYVALNGQKGYHGVVVLSRLPFESFDVQSFCGKSDCRHISAVLGDLNVAPLEHDVWSHKQMLRVVSHTPIECDKLVAVQKDGGWVDAMRMLVPEPTKLYTWWSYRSPDWKAADKGRRLDHIWVAPALADRLTGIEVLKNLRGSSRPSDHVPVTATLEV